MATRALKPVAPFDEKRIAKPRLALVAEAGHYDDLKAHSAGSRGPRRSSWRPWRAGRHICGHADDLLGLVRGRPSDRARTQLLGLTDLVAERVRKIGGTTLRSVSHIGRLQRVTDNDSDFVEPIAMLKELQADNMALITAFREAKELADEARDNATSALLDELTDAAEQRAWFLFEASRNA